jgi:hypothetical protein
VKRQAILEHKNLKGAVIWFPSIDRCSAVVNRSAIGAKARATNVEIDLHPYGPMARRGSAHEVCFYRKDVGGALIKVS